MDQEASPKRAAADTVVEVMVDLLGLTPDRIVDELSIEETPEWDSLKVMELVAELETTFAIELTYEEIASMRSVGAIKKVLEDRGL